MKLLIEIPEHIYEHAKEMSEDSRDEGEAMRAIANGSRQESSSEIPNTCGDAISREAAIKAIEALQRPIMREESNYYQFKFSGMSEALGAVENLPSVTPQPKVGRWIAYEVQLPDRIILNYRCSICGRKLIGYNTETLSEAPFCHCGAKMEVEE